MNDEQYIDIAIEISKKAKYPYGAILYEEFSKIVYAATLQDSNKKKKDIEAVIIKLLLILIY